ncbi:uncharacterized protein DUF1648 [Thermolongibacillus altinsuensis]|uniref:Uncharacterized protein DUF1648 n=1 Tax=Thermolongibacillus altinsuensis TaxID=575256 RepID=A0A4R1QJ53_9BACL|nr:DUF1648 domain-containing protein [Thermolongibacillus altinsuensis]TCL45963.1 uncharacterized protein DUF1648 [Thermolongibacillus altinsuensis]
MLASIKEKTKSEKVLLMLSIFGLVAMFVYVTLIWSELPETIPRHFNSKGEPDGFGGKGSILVLPFVGLGIFILTTLLSQIPNAFNDPDRVTEEQKQRLYIHGRICMSFLQTQIIYFLLYGVWQTAQVALGKASGLGIYVLPIFLFIIFGTIIYFTVRGQRMYRKE